MKKSFKIFISTILCLSVLFSIASCDYISGIINPKDDTNPTSNTTKDNTNKDNKKDRIVPVGYTAGITGDYHAHLVYGYYWLETYEEVLEAVELLKSHDSTILRSIAFDCDDEILDSKFCFKYARSKAEPLEEGKNFFDRKIDNCEFIWFGFLEDVNIDELLYSYIDRYASVNIWYVKSHRDFADISDADELTLDWYLSEIGYEPDGSYYIRLNGEIYVDVDCHKGVIPPEYYQEFANSIVIIE